ncbi:MAG: 4Fe-4S dicluster domain-containing protein [Planctomycetes bacterium]|nr:4Fe-4S dicluster domain-containing protein [Planctomycetota bacterium]
MIFSRYGTFTGGIDLPDNKEATQNEPIKACPPVSRLRLPLAARGGRHASAVVLAGQRVKAGQLLAAAADHSSSFDVFSPLDGLVAAVPDETAEQAGGWKAGSIELVELSHPQPIQPAQPLFDWRSVEPEELIEQMSAGGLTTFRRTQPLSEWVELARIKSCNTLIANMLENQPYMTAEHRLMVEHPQEVIEGLAMLARAMGVRQTIIVADQRRTGEYRELLSLSRKAGIMPVALPGKYPIGEQKVLIKVIRKREVPLGGWSMDVGVAMTNAAACFAAHRAVVCGQPPTARVVTISGRQANIPGNYWVPFGVSCLELAQMGQGQMQSSAPAAGASAASGESGKQPAPVQAEEHTFDIDDAQADDFPVLIGGPMTGRRCMPDDVVGPTVDAILVMDLPAPQPPTPCIRCGWCTDHCPARLNVALLNDAYELVQVDLARKIGVQGCVECGVCSYICPARLPLSQRVWKLKRAAFELQQDMPLFTADGGE